MDTRLPLQTHELYATEWIPPKSNSKFYSYDSKDTWLKDLGLGTYQRSLLDLYDVRDNYNKLIGYTRYNPADAIHGSMRTCIANYEPINYEPINPYPGIADPSYKTIRPITIRTSSYRVSGESFICWSVPNINDAIDLVKCGWIECLGHDNIQQFCCRLYEQLIKNRDMDIIFGRMAKHIKPPSLSMMGTV